MTEKILRADSRLAVAAGFTSRTGKRPDNQDFGGIYLGSESERALQGIVAAIADGVGGAKGGRIAAELAVRNFIEGYYTQPDTIGVSASVERVMAPYNHWLHSMARTQNMRNAATTFTAIIIRGRQAHIFHTGDSRAWLFRDGFLRQLTEDHTLRQPDLDHVLYRALGIEERLRLDHIEIDLAIHDRLLLTSDGVHGTLNARRLAGLLRTRGSAESDSDTIVHTALSAGSDDNASVILIDIVALPTPDFDGIAAAMGNLPIETPPDVNDSVDGFRLIQMLSDSRYTRLFRAENQTSGEAVVMKFPKTALLSEKGARLAFAREALIGQRVRSPFVGEVVAIEPSRQSRLYSVQPFYAGETLETRMKRRVPMEQGIAIAVRLTRAVAALHRLKIVHRDIKPDNVILIGDDGLRLIDLGVARLPRVQDFDPSEIPGTPSYMAPEQFTGDLGSELTDQFALGVTLYRMFTGRYPYGEIEPFTRPRFGRVEAPSRHRQEIPAWLDDAILRAVAADPAQRHDDIIGLLHALEGGGAAKRFERPRFQSLVERDPIRFWQGMSLFLALALLASWAWFSHGH